MPCHSALELGKQSGWLSLEVKLENARLVPRALLFGRVVAYKCTACGRVFAVPLLEGAVSSDLPTPLIVYAAFLEHECKGSDPIAWKSKYRSISMAEDDEDLPATYLLYAGAVILVIATVAITAWLFLFHS